MPTSSLTAHAHPSSSVPSAGLRGITAARAQQVGHAAPPSLLHTITLFSHACMTLPALACHCTQQAVPHVIEAGMHAC